MEEPPQPTLQAPTGKDEGLAASSGHSPAAQRRTPGSRSWATGAEERPAWLSAQLCGEESSQR